MNEPYHIQMTREALSPDFSAEALEQIVRANLEQDSLPNQIGHDHFHFDNNSLAASYAYIAACRQNAIKALRAGQADVARAEFGRLTHSVQDFYSHSNYIALWREQHPQAAPDQIDPTLESCLTDSRLHSARLYYPLEILAFIPPFLPLVAPHLPKDSHTHMHKDDPSRPDFEYAISAATKRTRVEWLLLAQSLTDTEKATFTGRGEKATSIPNSPTKKV